MGAVWYIIVPGEATIPYLGVPCAACYLTASTIQLICDFRPQKQTEEQTEEESPV